MFEREDWTLFRTLSTLGQKAGVPVEKLGRLVAKELADNALDAAGDCRVGLLPAPLNGFTVANGGEGIPGDDREVAAMFSVNRPLASSKQLRMPTRGALGNGLRVVAGAVMASRGRMFVWTGGRLLKLIPDPVTGRTEVERVRDWDDAGTVVRVEFGPALAIADADLAWARRAIALQAGDFYKGRSSPWWYDSESFHELLRASGPRTVRDLMAEFDGCGGAKAGRVAGDFKGRLARDLDAREADALLRSARALADPVKPSRLGRAGPWVDGFPASYCVVRGEFVRKADHGWFDAGLPYVVEAWAEAVKGESSIEAFVNRTPITAEIDLESNAKTKTLDAFGCNLAHVLAQHVRGSFRVRLGIIAPYMPITSDGKAPDFLPLFDPIAEAIGKAVKRAKGVAAGVRGSRPESVKALILKALPAAIEKAGGGGLYRFSLRQLFYAVRPSVIEATDDEPEYDYFSRVVADHEAERGEIPGMYRDPRGTLYHPHTGDEIPLGTISVERYGRPAWTFNKILYCEKEGFFPLLKDVRWPERHDCALMSAKGFANRAARDVIDLLGETGEPITFYCVHDADASGTAIYQALQEATKARPGRKVKIVNLGLEPAEGVAMGLQVEAVNRKGDKDRAAPVADYVEPEWRQWLQTNRVELNAMTTPQFLEWLDAKFAAESGKVVPPAEVLTARLERETRAVLEDRITRRVLRKARVADRVEAALARRLPELQAEAETIGDDVARELKVRPEEPWASPVVRKARRIAARRPSADSLT